MADIRLRGSRGVYRQALTLAVPMMLQSGVTTFVSLLDNIMVGQLGTEQMSGVAIANQLFFVFSMVIFGGMSGAGIYGAQFHGRGDDEGLRSVFRIDVWIAALASLAAACLFTVQGEGLLRLFLHDTGSGDLSLALAAGLDYLRVMRWMLPPFALLNAYSLVLCASGQTLPAMYAGLAAVGVNLVLDYGLIFGRLGLPCLGVTGAAVATLAARLVELGLLAWWTHAHPRINPFVRGLYRTLRVPPALLAKVVRCGLPLMVNEGLYSLATTTLVQCYSLRGLDTVAAVSISTTVTELFDIGLVALGNAIGVIVGNLLGAGEPDKARRADRQLIRFSVLATLPVALAMFCAAPLIPAAYRQTTMQVQQQAALFIRVMAVLMPFHALTNACYFTLRCGGKTVITVVFDSVFLWVLSVPCAWLLARNGAVPVAAVYAASQGLAVLKSAIGLVLVRSGIWAQVVVPPPPPASPCPDS